MNTKRNRIKKLPTQVVFSGALMVFIIFVCLFGPQFATHDPTEIDLLNKYAGSSLSYPFGTDDYGRCVFSRCLYAIRASVGIAFTVEFASVVIGTLLGMISAYVGGVFDHCVSVVSGALLSLPKMILVMLIVAFLGASTRNIILAMLLVNWIWYTRISRSMTLSLKERKYVQAANLCGASSATIIIKHICPSIMSQMIAQLTISVGGVILSLAGFSFLGIGVQRPTPELGVMISDGCSLIRTNFMVLFWPGLILFFIVLAFNILGEYVSDKLREPA